MDWLCLGIVSRRLRLHVLTLLPCDGGFDGHLTGSRVDVA